MRVLRKLAVVCLIGLPAVAGCGSSGNESTAAGESAAALAPVSGPYAPSIDPADFSSRIDNRYLPLRPGTVYRYAGAAEGGKTAERNTVTVTGERRRVLGVDCVVVRDVVYADGKPLESTLDWYAQDSAGNVWYFGEKSFDYEDGEWRRSEGSWEAGVDGAQPGIMMPAQPATGEEYRQEYYPGHAEDEAKVLGEGGPVRVPFGSYPRTLATYETSPLEPDVAERKLYVPGVGEVESRMVKGGRERSQLLSIAR